MVQKHFLHMSGAEGSGKSGWGLNRDYVGAGEEMPGRTLSRGLKSLLLENTWSLILNINKENVW